MGMFDFMKDAGDDVTATVEVSSERMNELRQQNITSSLAQLDIDGEQVDVSVNGDAVVLTGTAPSQEAMEKMVLCAGNQHGIGHVDCRVEVVAPAASPEAAASAAAAPAAAAPASAEASTFYTVQSGDTLGKIAAAHYGNAGKYTVIFEANQPMLSDPDKIYPGQSLRIPAL